MKQKAIQHPKLYLSISNESSGHCKLNFLANKFDDSGNRLLEAETMESTQLPSNDNVLFNLNKRELEGLNIFIFRQKKVLETYKKRNELDKVRIIKDSLNIFLDFKKMFDDWFQNNRLNLT